MGKDVIVACDFDSAEKVFAFLDLFEGLDRKPFVKIGMELYYAEGPSIVREIKARGHKIFLDLKLHDIPNTVKKAMNVLSRLDVDISRLRLLEDNSYLPVDMGNGIMFVEAVSGQGKNYEAESVYQCWLGDDTDNALIEALKTNKASDLGLEFQVIVSWGSIQLKHTFSDDTVKDYMDNWTGLAMFLKLIGAEDIKDLTYQSRIVFADETEAEVVVWAGAKIPHSK